MASRNMSGSPSARTKARTAGYSRKANRRVGKKGRHRAPFLSTAAVRRAGLALSPGRLAAPDVVARRQRHARFQPFEFDLGAGADPQQSVGGFAQRRPTLLRVLLQRRVE